MVTEAEIVAFVAEQTGCPLDRIDPEDLLGSTGFEGDDAFELIETFSERFEVDLSKYVWDFHHEDEGALLTVNPFVKSPHRRVERIPLTAAMLAGFARRGRWELDYPPYRPVNARWDILLSPMHLIFYPAALLALVVLILSWFGVLHPAC